MSPLFSTFNSVRTPGRLSTGGLNAVGGFISTATIGGINYRLHIFPTVGNNNFQITSGGGTVDVMLVGGGGGGGVSLSGGGGGGAVIVATGITVTPQTYTIAVGDGGTGGTGEQSSASNGTNGGSTSAFGITATGGGGGVARRFSSNTLGGANGGGGSSDSLGSSRGSGGTGTAPSLPGGVIGTVYAGYTGGTGGGGGDNYPGGGGAGSAQNGETPGNQSSRGGKGGDGIQITNFYGASHYWAAGGGGSSYVGGNGGGPGGTGGGGGGWDESSGGGGSAGLLGIREGNPGGTGNSQSAGTLGAKGGTNTGSGGACSAHNYGTGGSGGSGIAIVRYRNSGVVPADPASGGGFSVAQGANGDNVTGFTNTGMTVYELNTTNQGIGSRNHPLNYACTGSTNNFSFHTGHQFGPSTNWWPGYYAFQVTTSTYGKVLNQINWYKHSNAVGNCEIFGSNNDITASNFDLELLWSHLGRFHAGGFGSASDCNVITASFNPNGYGYKWYMIKFVDNQSSALSYPSVGSRGGWAMYGLRLNKV